MITAIAVVSVVVEDQDEALEFYTEKLGLEPRDDVEFGEGGRWVTVAPPDENTEIYLEPASELDDGDSLVGRAPAPAFHVDDCRATYEEMVERGVEFTSEPEEMPWGVQAVAADLYGNSLVFVEPAE